MLPVYDRYQGFDNPQPIMIVCLHIAQYLMMILRWTRVKKLLKFSFYVSLILLSSVLIISLPSLFPLEHYENQVLLEDEIKSEIDLSIEEVKDGKISLERHKTVQRELQNIHVEPTQNQDKNLYLEEFQNKALLKEFQSGISLSQISVGSDNTTILGNQEGCNGKGASDEIKFHEITRNIHIYSAFWDARPNDFDNKPGRAHIRLMAIASKETRKPPLSCLFYIRGAYHIIPTSDYEMCENHNKKYEGHIYSCQVPSAVKTHICSVLVAHGSLADPKWATRIPVTNTEIRTEQQYKFAQCVPPLFGRVKEDHLIQFIEMSRMMGTEYFTFYDMKTPKNIEKVLKYYHWKGIAQVIPWPLPKRYQNEDLWYNGQIVAIQDCLYRNMATTGYLAFLDLDEFVVPRKYKDFNGLVNEFDTPNRCGLVFKSAFFDPNNKHRKYSWIKHFEYLDLAKNVMRSEMLSKFRNKCLVKPRTIFEKGIHHISKPVNSSMQVYEIDPEVALLHHYRKCSSTYGQDCSKFVEDKSAWKLVSKLHKRVLFASEWINKVR